MGSSKVKRRALRQAQNAIHVLREQEVKAGPEMKLSSLSMGTTDDARANKFIEYEIDIYFATKTESISAGSEFFPARQLNMDLTALPGVDRQSPDANKGVVLVKGSLYARPLWSVSGGAFNSNPNIYSGRLVTPLGTDLGSSGSSADEISLYDNGIKNLEPNVDQNYVHVNTFKYLDAMPDVAPASSRRESSEYTNLLSLGLVVPTGEEWDGELVAFRFNLVYRVPVVLTSACFFAIEANSESGGTIEDGILSLARNMRDKILPTVGPTSSLNLLEQPCFPDARKIVSQ